MTTLANQSPVPRRQESCGPGTGGRGRANRGHPAPSGTTRLVAGSPCAPAGTPGTGANAASSRAAA